MKVSLTLNGRTMEADGVEANASLLDLLRDDLGHVGTKDACRQGECGSCTVLLEDQLVCSCLVHAAQADGRSVETIEGSATSEDRLTDLQQALVQRGAVQCGFCTPGIVVAAQYLLDRTPQPTEGDVRAAISGNLCRCTGYQAIVDAVLDVAGERGEPGA
jgi:aerobic carbon-monoxide dehydrogenase small subunit